MDWADGFVVVYNISDLTSFINAKNILQQIREARTDNCKGSEEAKFDTLRYQILKCSDYKEETIFSLNLGCFDNSKPQKIEPLKIIFTTSQHMTSFSLLVTSYAAYSHFLKQTAIYFLEIPH